MEKEGAPAVFSTAVQSASQPHRNALALLQKPLVISYGLPELHLSTGLRNRYPVPDRWRVPGFFLVST
jgi:hypothetical protein